MVAPNILGRYRTIPASKLLATLGESLETIRAEDELSYPDLGKELHKHGDSASSYCKATADMPTSTFLQACRLWNGRFANAALALIGMKLVPLEGVAMPDRRAMSVLARVQAEISENLEDDVMTDDELLEDREWIEQGGAIFDGWRQRLASIDVGRGQ